MMQAPLMSYTDANPCPKAAQLPTAQFGFVTGITLIALLRTLNSCTRTIPSIISYL